MEPARFAELFDRHYPAILRYLRRRVGHGLADDLAAETFTLAFRRRRQYRAEHPDAAAWLYGIAGNLLRQHARAEVRRLRAYARVVPDPIGPDVGDGVAERIDATAAARRAALAVADLPAGQREVLLLFAWAELDCAGIARALGVPPGTARSRLHRARQRLRRQLGWAAVEELENPQPAPPGRMSDDELDLVRSIAADTAEPEAATTQAARTRLLAVIAAEAAAGQPQPTRDRRRAPRLAGRVRPRRLLPGSAVVAAVLAAAVAAPLLLLQRPATVPGAPGTGTQPPGSIGSAEPTVDRVLTNAALAAAREPAPGFGPGEYWYVLERGVKLGTNRDQAGSEKGLLYRFGYQSETWWALDGSLSGHLHNGRAEFLDDTERAAWIAAGRPDLGLPNTEVYSPKVKMLVAGLGGARLARPGRDRDRRAGVPGGVGGRLPDHPAGIPPAGVVTASCRT